MLDTSNSTEHLLHQNTFSVLDRELLTFKFFKPLFDAFEMRGCSDLDKHAEVILQNVVFTL